MKRQFDVKGLKKATDLLRKNGAEIDGRVIRMQSPGLKLIGAIDYLVEKGGYEWKRTKV